MKAAAGSAGISFALLLVLLLGAAPVQARARPEVQPAYSRALISLGEDHGYDIGLSIAPHAAVLYAFKFPEEDEPGSYVQAAYAIRARNSRVDEGVARASFPSLGRISLRFHPNGKRRLRRSYYYCRGEATVTESGTFRGTVSLRGENGYFAIKKHSAPGVLERSPRLLCRHGYADDLGAPLSAYLVPPFGFFYSPGRRSIALLYALAERKNGYVALRAAHRAGRPPGAEVQVQTFERRPGMMVARSASLDEGGPGTFATSLPGFHPATATLAPPAPFSGEAQYLENSATSHSWTGTLSIAMPGAEVPLAGPEFKTSLCVVSPLRTSSGCDLAKPKPLRGARFDLLRRWWR